jgi:hypothetical protein
VSSKKELTVEKQTRFRFYRFHDVDGIADFIILKQYYDSAIQREWKTSILKILQLTKCIEFFVIR